ncbi:MAG: hypothetical protein CME82_05770 [Halomonas sp.]|nr:hypothetical protein [Halomonas sp.]
MVRGYLARFPARIARLYTAHEERDFDMLVGEARELHHASTTLGCTAVVAVVEAIIEHGEMGRHEPLVPLIKELEDIGTRTGLAWRTTGVLDSFR